jgi:hypothetical protein
MNGATSEPGYGAALSGDGEALTVASLPTVPHKFNQITGGSLVEICYGLFHLVR